MPRKGVGAGFWGFRFTALEALGFRDLRFRVYWIWGLGIWCLGFRDLGFTGFRGYRV